MKSKNGKFTYEFVGVDFWSQKVYQVKGKNIRLKMVDGLLSTFVDDGDGLEGEPIGAVKDEYQISQ